MPGRIRPSALPLPYPCGLAVLRRSAESCAVGAFGLWDDFVACHSLLSFRVPTAVSLLHAELAVSLFHAGAALIEAVNQLAGAVDIND